MAVILLSLVGITAQAADPAIPHITVSDRGWVDTTETVPAATMEALRKESDRVHAGGYQLAGVFFSDIESDPSQFTSDVGNVNGIGSAEKDNGLMILVLLDRKGSDGNKPYIFVAPGRGLEGDLPDSAVTRFREKYFNPLRAQGRWEEGLISLSRELANFMVDLSNPESQSPNPQPTQSTNDGNALMWVILIFGAIVAAVVIFLVVLARKSQKQDPYFDPVSYPISSSSTRTSYTPQPDPYPSHGLTYLGTAATLASAGHSTRRDEPEDRDDDPPHRSSHHHDDDSGNSFGSSFGGSGFDSGSSGGFNIGGGESFGGGGDFGGSGSGG